MQSRFHDLFHIATVLDVVARLGSGGFLLFFLIGASFVGADWTSQQIVQEAQWEPRRGRILIARQAVLVGVTLTAAAVLAIGLLIAALPATLARGTFFGVDAAWTQDYLLTTARLACSWMAGILIGFNLANLGRRTAAALGVFAFYWLFEIVAIIGIHNPFRLFATVDWFVETSTGVGSSSTTSGAALFLGGLCALLALVSTLQFLRRDLT